MLKKGDAMSKFDPSVTPMSPFLCKINGHCMIEGVIRADVIKDVLKKITFVIAAQVSTSTLNWENLAPILYSGLKLLILNRLVYHQHGDTPFTKRISTDFNHKFISLLSHLPSDSIPEFQNIKHRWEFETFYKGHLVISYDICIAIEVYDYTLYDHYLFDGYNPFPDNYNFYKNSFDILFQKCVERPIDPSHALTMLSIDGYWLKKLLFSKSKRITVLDEPNFKKYNNLNNTNSSDKNKSS